MKKHSLVQNCAVLAAVAAAGLVSAADAPSPGGAGQKQEALKPASGFSILQKVPGLISSSNSSEQQTQRRPGSTSRASGIRVRTISHDQGGRGGLLSALGLRSSGESSEQQPQPKPQPQPQPKKQLQPAPAAAPQQIAEQPTNPAQQRRAEKREWRKENPGFFRRVFNSIVEVEGEEDQVAENGRAPGVPQPPALVYETENGNKNTTAGKSVQARTVGFRKTPAQNAAAPGPQPHPIRRSTEFVSPFVDDAPAVQDDIALDLDSLIEVQNPILTDPNAMPQLEEEQPAPIAADEATPLVSTESPEAVEASVREEAAVIAEDVAATDTVEELQEVPADLPADEPVQAEPLVQDQPETTADEAVAATPEADASAVGQNDSDADLTPPEEVKTADNTADGQQSDGQSRREQQRYRIMSRSGQSGFKGFCPVALRDERELVDSSEEFTAKFGLRTYQFSSAQAKAAFESNPARYAPVAAGSDVVLLVNTEEEISGVLDFSLWYRDRLYLFRSRETQRIFAANPDKYASQY